MIKQACSCWCFDSFSFFSQLLVGSEDFDIRVFKEDEIIAEMTETEVGKCSMKTVIEYAFIFLESSSMWLSFL